MVLGLITDHEATTAILRLPTALLPTRAQLEVEPENPRVQMRLAELYNVMGQKSDAAKTYLAYAQRLFDRGIAVIGHTRVRNRQALKLTCMNPTVTENQMDELIRLIVEQGAEIG